MFKTLKYKLILIAATLTLSVPVILPLEAGAMACNNNVGSNISTGINATQQGTSAVSAPSGSCSGGSITTGVSSLAVKVVNLFSIVVGIVSVIMIIYAGFRYVTSGGESGSVSSAKSTLIYAIVGLVIVVLAQLIVRYVLNTANGVGTSIGG